MKNRRLSFPLRNHDQKWESDVEWVLLNPLRQTFYTTTEMSVKIQRSKTFPVTALLLCTRVCEFNLSFWELGNTDVENWKPIRTNVKRAHAKKGKHPFQSLCKLCYSNVLLGPSEEDHLNNFSASHIMADPGRAGWVDWVEFHGVVVRVLLQREPQGLAAHCLVFIFPWV